MDIGLFGKYAAVLTKQKNSKDEIILCIENSTGVKLSPEEIIIKKKNISFQTSSVNKMVMRTKKIDSVLQTKGYTCSF